jgi:hypothetical protein
MQPSLQPKDDITASETWQNEQIDRLLAWETLQRAVKSAVTGQPPEPVDATELCDSIGVNKGYAHNVLLTVREKLNAK